MATATKPLGVPYFIQKRIGKLYGYADKNIFPPHLLRSIFHKQITKAERTELQKRRNLMVAEASWVIFIFLIKRFLEASTENAEFAIAELKKSGVEEFELGKKIFAEGNENVMAGQILSDILMRELKDKKLKKIIFQSQTVREILYKYKRHVMDTRLKQTKSKYFFNQKEMKQELRSFFRNESVRLKEFGKTVNQTFEAYVWAWTVSQYRNQGWLINIVNPKEKRKEKFKLKFNTNGHPHNFSYAICKNGSDTVEIRHQLRIATSSSDLIGSNNANVCCDVAIVKPLNKKYYSDEGIPNELILSFGEAKHMSAYAELVASFIGLVHELIPSRLTVRTSPPVKTVHLAPFLFVSGFLQPTANAIQESINKRNFDISIHSFGEMRYYHEMGEDELDELLEATLYPVIELDDEVDETIDDDDDDDDDTDD